MGTNITKSCFIRLTPPGKGIKVVPISQGSYAITLSKTLTLHIKLADFHITQNCYCSNNPLKTTLKAFKSLLVIAFPIILGALASSYIPEVGGRDSKYQYCWNALVLSIFT